MRVVDRVSRTRRRLTVALLAPLLTALNFLYEVRLLPRTDVAANELTYYRSQTLAAVALNEDLPEPDDRTVPAYETIEQVRPPR